jgi:hypothetical protein
MFVRTWEGEVMPEPLKLGTAQYTYLWDYSLRDSLKKVRDLGFK